MIYLDSIIDLRITGFLKALWASISGYFLTVFLYFLPVRDITWGIIIVFFVNWFWGYIAGMVVQKESFRIKKALWAMLEMMVYMGFVIMIFVIGNLMKEPSKIMQALNIITWAWIIIYSINILKNLKRLFPHNEPISFLYYIVSFEFVTSIPYLKNFEEYQQKLKQQQNENN